MATPREWNNALVTNSSNSVCRRIYQQYCVYQQFHYICLFRRDPWNLHLLNFFSISTTELDDLQPSLRITKSWLVFMVFPNPSRQIPGQYLQFGTTASFHTLLGRPHTNCVKTSLKTWDKRDKSWRQHHELDRCAAVFIISFVSTVLLSLPNVADIVSWLLHVLTHAGVRPTSQFIIHQMFCHATLHNLTNWKRR
jgi:hypothetical protein